MLGTLYVIGVGPGDPELLTLKALKILKDIPVIYVPKGREAGSSTALSIVSKVVSVADKEIVEAYFPMKKRMEDTTPELTSKWEEITLDILGRLNRGTDAAFITLGDPSIYSTFFYLYDRIMEKEPGLKIVIIPGVSSVNASAASARISLGLADKKIAIFPATYGDDIKKTLQEFETIVLMKVHTVFDKLLKDLHEMDIVNKAIYISKAGMDDETILHDIRKVRKEDLTYFSMVIIRR